MITNPPNLLWYVFPLAIIFILLKDCLINASKEDHSLYGIFHWKPRPQSFITIHGKTQESPWLTIRPDLNDIHLGLYLSLGLPYHIAILQWRVNIPWVSSKLDCNMWWALDPKYINAALNSLGGSTLWDFPFKNRTKTLYQKNVNTQENPHPTIRVDLKYYILEFIVIDRSGISQRTLYINLGFHRLWYAIGEANSIMYVLYMIVLSSLLYRIGLMARLWLLLIVIYKRIWTQKYIYYG